MRHEIGKSYIEYSEDCGEVVIDMLFVDKEQRGNKLGYKLIDVALSYAREQGMDLTLCSYPQDDSISQADLIEYYRGYGFESDSDCDELMKY